MTADVESSRKYISLKFFSMSKSTFGYGRIYIKSPSSCKKKYRKVRKKAFQTENHFLEISVWYALFIFVESLYEDKNNTFNTFTYLYMYKLVWDMRICVSIPVPDVIPETSSLSLLIVSDNKLPL